MLKTKVPMSPELLRKSMMLGCGEDHPVVVAFEKGQRWAELERYCNFVLHAYYLNEIPDYFFEEQYWKRVDKDKVESPWQIVLEFGDGTVAARQTSPWLFGIGEKN